MNSNTSEAFQVNSYPTFEESPSVKVSFYYDSRNYALPFPFTAMKLKVNGTVVVSLTVDKKKEWRHTQDVSELLVVGSNTIDAEIQTFTYPGNNTRGLILLDVDGDKDILACNMGPTPPGDWPFPNIQMDKVWETESVETCTKSWTVIVKQK